MRTSRRDHWRRWAALPVVALLAAAWAAGTTPAAVAPAAVATRGHAASVSVNAGSALATVPATAIGINGSVYDAALTDAAVPGLLKSAGTNADPLPRRHVVGHLQLEDQHRRACPASGRRWTSTSTPRCSSQTGAQGMITVNYGTGDAAGATQSPAETGAQLAADWVRYANVTHHYGIKYWEIGNEIYGNGTYGGNWEPDQHCATGSNPTNCGPAVYAQNVKAYISAMKAVDPSIVVGVVLTAPGQLAGRHHLGRQPAAVEPDRPVRRWATRSASPTCTGTRRTRAPSRRRGRPTPACSAPTPRSRRWCRHLQSLLGQYSGADARRS